MCNACGFLCCAHDGLDGCGCDGCREPNCHNCHERCDDCGDDIEWCHCDDEYEDDEQEDLW